MTNRERLGEMAGLAGIDSEWVRVLLWLLNAPVSLPEVVTVLTNLLEALEIAESALPGVLNEEKLGFLPALLAALLPITASLPSTPNDERVRPHSLYFAMASSRPSLSREYRMLQALCFLAHARCMRAITTPQEYEQGPDDLPKKLSWMYHCGLGLRHVGSSETWSDDYLQKLPMDVPLDEVALCSRVDVVSGERDPDWVRDQVGYIDVLLRRACGLPVRGSDGGSSSGRKLGRVEVDEYPGSEDEDPHWTEEDQRNEPEQKSSLRITVAAYRNQIILANKLFVNTIGNLLPHELAPIEVDSRAEIECILLSRNISSEDLRAIELRLILLLTLWTGGPESHRTSLRFVQGADDQPEVGFAAYEGETSELWFRRVPPFPDYATIQGAARGSRASRRSMLLPDVADLGPLLRRFAALRRSHSDAQDEHVGNCEAAAILFPGLPDEYRRELKSLLRKLDPSGRLTMPKLATALFMRVAAATEKDALAATLITGRKHPTTKVGMYYVSREIALVQARYWDAARDLRETIWKERLLPVPPQAPIILSPRGSYIGKRICPTVERVQEMASAIIDDLSRPWRFSDSEYHNLYTLYALEFFGFLTGMRAITNPLVCRDAIGPTTHTVLVRDKDSDSGEKGKWVFLIGSLVRQIELYAEHVRDRYLELPQGMPCFFVDPTGHHREWTPSHSADLLKRYMPGFPVGVHRRFSYNYLLDAGCPPESVRIWMGHSTRGDEFWARGATLSFDRHRLILEPYLLDLARILGFMPIRSAMQ